MRSIYIVFVFFRLSKSTSQEESKLKLVLYIFARCFSIEDLKKTNFVIHIHEYYDSFVAQ